jgi:hypothetical protein
MCYTSYPIVGYLAVEQYLLESGDYSIAVVRSPSEPLRVVQYKGDACPLYVYGTIVSSIAAEVALRFQLAFVQVLCVAS